MAAELDEIFRDSVPPFLAMEFAVVCGHCVETGTAILSGLRAVVANLFLVAEFAFEERRTLSDLRRGNLSRQNS